VQTVFILSRMLNKIEKHFDQLKTSVEQHIIYTLNPDTLIDLFLAMTSKIYKQVKSRCDISRQISMIYVELMKSLNRIKFTINPSVVNAYYTHEKNSICKLVFYVFNILFFTLYIIYSAFPDVISQQPFFSNDFPKFSFSYR